MLIVEPIRINEFISYIPQVERPLSSDIVLIQGGEKLYVWDVGNRDDATTYLNELNVPKCVILSHFHSDHIARLEDTVFDELYLGNQTYKTVRNGIVVDRPITIKDRITLTILPVPSTHAKGCLALMVNDTYLFTGDATYAMWKDDKTIYNAQLLKEEMDLFSSLPATKYFLSHDNGKLRKKEVVLKLLENIYNQRDPSSPWIYL